MNGSVVLHLCKCPTCGGAVRFDARTGALSCAWCHNAYDAAGLETKEVGATPQGYLCPECGAQLMSDDFIAADICPYCGNNEVAPRRFDGAFEPDFIIPFSVTKKRAIECYEEHLVGKEFLLEGFADEAQVLSVQGVYVPFWLKSGTIEFDLTYTGQKMVGSGKNAHLDERHYRRMGTYRYSRVPADGSERMADDLMDSIEPYDFEQMEPFSTTYLPGFVAERYTVDGDKVDRRTYFRMQVAANRAARRTIEQLHEGPFSMNDRCWTRNEREADEQVLLPVWLVAVAHKDEKYLVAVNGQTGKVAANLPVNERKQKEHARKATAKHAPFLALSALPVVALLAFFVFITSDLLQDSVTKIATGTAPHGEGASPIMGLVFSFLLYAAVIYFGVIGGKIIYRKLMDRYESASESARTTVQNMQEAAYRAEFDMDAMAITYSANESGPSDPNEAFVRDWQRDR